MRNFAIFLLIGNIAWWSWQFFFHGNELSDAINIQPTGFVQAEKKLQMLSDLPSQSPADRSGMVQTAGIEVGRGIEAVATTSTADVAVPSVAPPPAIPSPWCGVSSGIASADRAGKFQAEWIKKAGEAEQESVKEPGSPTWWVYLPFKDEEAAQLVLKQLHEKSIDSYYMRTGDLAGSISLGVFSRRESAVGIRDAIRKKGYAAEVREMPRMEARIRLVLKLRDREKIGDSTVQEFLSKNGDIQVKEIDCK